MVFSSFLSKKYAAFYRQSSQNGIGPKRGWDRFYVMLCSLYTPAITVRVLQLCRGAEADNLTMLSCYISSLTHMYHIPFSLGPKRHLAVEVLNWESAPTWLAENGCCMCWWCHLRTLCCGLFLSCRLLCSWCSRLWLLITFVLSLFCASRFSFVFHATWQTCMQSFFTGWWLTVFDFGWHFYALWETYTKYGLVFNFLIWHVYLCVCFHAGTSAYVQAQKRSMLPSLTSSKHTLLYFTHSVQKRTLSQVLCVITDSLFPPHILWLSLTVLLSTSLSLTHIHTHTNHHWCY